MGFVNVLQNKESRYLLSTSLPVIEQGGDPMTLTVPADAHQLTIKYALFGAFGNLRDGRSPQTS